MVASPQTRWPAAAARETCLHLPGSVQVSGEFCMFQEVSITDHFLHSISVHKVVLCAVGWGEKTWLIITTKSMYFTNTFRHPRDIVRKCGVSISITATATVLCMALHSKQGQFVPWHCSCSFKGHNGSTTTQYNCRLCTGWTCHSTEAHSPFPSCSPGLGCLVVSNKKIAEKHIRLTVKMQNQILHHRKRPHINSFCERVWHVMTIKW